MEVGTSGGKVLCHGCGDKHPRFLFSPQSIHDYQNNHGELLCIDWLGYVSLCCHKTPRTQITWAITRDDTQNWNNKTDECICTHYFHRPLTEVKLRQHISASPRLIVLKGNDSTSLRYGCDTPLLDIDQRYTPMPEQIQEAVLTIFGDENSTYSVCRHVKSRELHRKFVRSGICACFAKPGQTLAPFSKDPRYDCFCERERYLTCGDCGAVHAWQLEAGRVHLVHRYIWVTCDPTSPL